MNAGMTLDYKYPGEIRIIMVKYVEDVIQPFAQARLTFNEEL